MTTKFYSVAEYGKLIGYSRVAVINWINKGWLKATRVGKAYVIPEDQGKQHACRSIRIGKDEYQCLHCKRAMSLQEVLTHDLLKGKRAA